MKRHLEESRTLGASPVLGKESRKKRQRCPGRSGRLRPATKAGVKHVMR